MSVKNENQTENEDAVSIKFKALFTDDDNAIRFMEYVSKTISAFGIFGEVRDEFEKICKITNSPSFSGEAGKDMDKIRKGLIDFCLHHHRIYLAWTDIKGLKTLYPEKAAEDEKEKEKGEKQKFSIGDTLTNPQASTILQEISARFSDQNQLKSFWYYIRSIPLDNSNNRYSDDEVTEAVEISGHLSLTDVTRFAFNHYDIYGVWKTFTEYLKKDSTNLIGAMGALCNPFTTPFGRIDPNPMNMIGKMNFAAESAQQFQQSQKDAQLFLTLSSMNAAIKHIDENLSKMTSYCAEAEKKEAAEKGPGDTIFGVTRTYKTEEKK